ncbi:hypothetical protein [Mycolicibacterium arseniciresistens]|uniref:Uncharacterized protein n=1 Tax=Mycolicibacterium arseniciresistens TaxID=3062257 RepID=A0ABT8UC64_9MYCO|nr:hypothetical protein [Mycolicibacterium arseniciresistens]MDO3634692.1 hypothetical protein [Mycolicibacterium arseniciresistens]
MTWHWVPAAATPRCEVAEAGVSGRDSESGHGFSLLRETYRLF